MSDIVTSQSLSIPPNTTPGASHNDSHSIGAGSDDAVQKETHSEINAATMVQRAQAIRARLRRPENAMVDIPIDLKNRERRPLTMGALREAVKKCDSEILDLRARLEGKKSERARLQMWLLHNSKPSDRIKDIVAEHFGVTVNDLISERRDKDIVLPRQVAQYVMKEATCYSLPKIGAAFGNRDHTTVMHSIKRVREKIENDAAFADDVHSLIVKVGRLLSSALVVDPGVERMSD